MIPLVLASASVLGLLDGLMIHFFEIQPFIATLAAMFLARGLCYRHQRRVDLDQRTRSSVPLADRTIALPAASSSRGASSSPLVVVAIAVWVLHPTRFGRTVYAIGGSEQLGLLMGLPVARTKVPST